MVGPTFRLLAVWAVLALAPFLRPGDLAAGDLSPEQQARIRQAEEHEGKARGLAARGEYDQAEEHILTALDLKQRALGRDHPALAAPLCQLAEFYRSAGGASGTDNLFRSGPAMFLLARAAAILEADPDGGHDRDLARVYEKLGDAASIGDPGLAGTAGEKAYHHLRRTLPPGEAALTTALAKAAAHYDHVGAFWGFAEGRATCATHARELLAATEQRLGRDHLECARILHILGTMLRSSPADAEWMLAGLERALAIRRRELPADHLLVAESEVDLARHLLGDGDAAGFRRHFAAAREIWKTRGEQPLLIDPGLLDAKNPELPRTHEWIRQLGKILAALEAWHAAREQDGESAAGTRAAARNVLARAVANQQNHDYRFTLRLAEEETEHARANDGANSMAHAEALVWLARCHLNRGSPEDAVQALSQAAKITAAKRGRTHDETADAYAGLAFARCAAGQYREAARDYEGAIRIREGRKGPSDIEDLRVRTNLAVTCFFGGEYDQAHEVLDVLMEALRTDPALRENLQAVRDEPETARVYGDLGQACRMMGRYTDELFLAFEAGDFRALAGQEDLRLLGLCGEFRKALLESRERAAKGKLVKGEFNQYQVVRLKKVEALLAVGACTEAYADLLELVDWIEATMPRVQLGMQIGIYLNAGPAYTLLAESLLERGLAEEAGAIGAKAFNVHQSLPRAFAQSRGVSPAETPAQAGTIDLRFLLRQRVERTDTRAPEAYARALLALDRNDRALRILEETLAEQELRLPAEHPRTGETLAAVARCHLAGGRLPEARAAAETAVAVFRKAYPADHPILADPLFTLADVDVLEGESAAAEERFRQVLDLSKTALFDSHLNFPIALSGIAVARAGDGRAESALEPMRQALLLLGKRVRMTQSGTTTRERVGLMAAVHWGLANWLEVSRTAGIDGYEEVLGLKGYVGRVMALEQQLYRGSTGKARQLYDELRIARRGLARLAHQPPRPGWTTHIFRRRVAEAAGRCAALEKQLSRSFGAFGDATRRLDLSVDAVAGQLGRDEVLVDVLLAGGSYTAWVLAGRDSPVRVELGPAEALEPLMQTFRDAVRGAKSIADPAWREAGAALRVKLWDPIAAALPEGIATLFLVPDGALCAVPLRALPGVGGETVLDDEFRLVLLSTATQLVSRKPPPRRGRGIAVVGGVNYDATDRPQLPEVTGLVPLRERVPNGRKFAPLPGTAKEAAFVLSLFKGRAVHLTGPAATESGLREAVVGRQFLHIATHGFLREAQDGSLRLPRGAEFRLRAGLELHAQRFDPMLLSGLALSGANQRIMEDDDDGVLTALEAMELNLDGVDLAVLSACETALGIQQAGEGMIGLVRGFSLAGADNVVASLWPVSDEAALVLMQGFYRHLTEEQASPADALRAAARELRTGGAFTSPTHWAAFVSYGASR